MSKIVKLYHQKKDHDKLCNYISSKMDYAFWKLNITTGEIFFSEKAKEMTGYRLNHIKSLSEFINAVACEKDKAAAMEDLLNYTKGISPVYQSVFRVESKNREIKWFLLNGKISRDPLVCCDLFSGVILDVTQNEFLKKHDNLTKLPNREFFYERLKNSIKRAKACNRKGAVIDIDINSFKTLNNNFGHNSGDIILKLLSQFLTTLLGKYDELARIGDDEFIILIHDFTDITELTEICNKIFEYLKTPVTIMDAEIYITVSVGIAIFPEDSSNADELLKLCSYAIYNSRQNGKNQYTFFDRGAAEIYFRKILIECEIKNAILNDEIYVFYQPQVDAISKKVTGIEALLRWNNNKLGNVSPAEFIPIAEKCGCITEIGNWVLDRVLKTASLWKEKGYKFDNISINISSIQIKENNFKDNLLNTCSKYNISPSLIEIEITEGTLVEICEEKIEMFHELMSAGIHIAIDDFGKGYSSFNYLVALPVNTLKIDKSFTDNIENDRYRFVVKNILDLSKSLKYKVITEGVETEEQLNLITELGCNIIQGYYFSKPIPENEIENLLKEQS